MKAVLSNRLAIASQQHKKTATKRKEVGYYLLLIYVIINCRRFLEASMQNLRLSLKLQLLPSH